MRESAPDPVFVLRGAESPVTALTFICPSEGQRDSNIAAGTQDGQIFVWNLKVWTPIQIFSGNFNKSIVMKTYILAMSLLDYEKYLSVFSLTDQMQGDGMGRPFR